MISLSPHRNDMETKMKPERDASRILLRLPESLRDKIKETAEENYRSINAEIVYRLIQTYTPQIKNAEAA